MVNQLTNAEDKGKRVSPKKKPSSSKQLINVMPMMTEEDQSNRSIQGYKAYFDRTPMTRIEQSHRLEIQNEREDSDKTPMIRVA